MTDQPPQTVTRTFVVTGTPQQMGEIDAAMVDQYPTALDGSTPTPGAAYTEEVIRRWLSAAVGQEIKRQSDALAQQALQTITITSTTS